MVLWVSVNNTSYLTKGSYAGKLERRPGPFEVVWRKRHRPSATLGTYFTKLKNGRCHWLPLPHISVLADLLLPVRGVHLVLAT